LLTLKIYVYKLIINLKKYLYFYIIVEVRKNSWLRLCIWGRSKHVDSEKRSRMMEYAISTAGLAIIIRIV